MIKHIVCFKIKDEAEGKSKADNIAIMTELLLSLKNKLPMLKSLEVGKNSPLADASNFDVALITTFDSMNDLNNYQVHPEHKKVAEFIGKIRESRACIDFEY